MAKHRFIFFDVGNTLLFPNRSRMLAPLPAERHPTLEAWQALERRTKQEFDQTVLEGKVDPGFWWTFHTHLLQGLDAMDDGVRDTLVENTRHSANWDQILPGTRAALDRLRKQYEIAVVSNADGKIEAVSCTAAGFWIAFRASQTPGRWDAKSRIRLFLKRHCAR